MYFMLYKISLLFRKCNFRLIYNLFQFKQIKRIKNNCAEFPELVCNKNQIILDTSKNGY